jgi:enamine deaminase RidA (YjgF/YER057c/UK114 family)
VANGASELLVAVLGEEGKHARAAIGMSSLPLGGCIEVVVTAEVAPS